MMTSAVRARLLFVAAISSASSGLLTVDAHAAPPAPGAAAAATNEAKSRLDAGKALVQQGKLVDASKELHAAMDAAKGAPLAKRHADAAKKLLDEIEPKIPWIQITTNGPAPGAARTFIDGVAIDASSEVPFDPGEHVVAAEAEGFAREEQRVQLVEGAHAKLTLDLKGRAPVAVTMPAPPPEQSKGSIVPALAGFGVGAVGLVLGGVFGGMAFSEKSKADDAKAGYLGCLTKGCSNATRAGYAGDFQNALDTSKTNGTISTVGFVIGGVGVAAGVTLLFWNPLAPKNAPATSLAVRPVVGLGRVGLEGAF